MYLWIWMVLNSIETRSDWKKALKRILFHENLMNVKCAKFNMIMITVWKVLEPSLWMWDTSFWVIWNVVPGKTIDIIHKSADKMWENLLILSSVLMIEYLDVKIRFWMVSIESDCILPENLFYSNKHVWFCIEISNFENLTQYVPFINFILTYGY